MPAIKQYVKKMFFCLDTAIILNTFTPLAMFVVLKSCDYNFNRTQKFAKMSLRHKCANFFLFTKLQPHTHKSTLLLLIRGSVLCTLDGRVTLLAPCVQAAEDWSACFQVLNQNKIHLLIFHAWYY